MLPKEKKKEWYSLPFRSSPAKNIVVLGPESCISVSSRSTTAPSLYTTSDPITENKKSSIESIRNASKISYEMQVIQIFDKACKSKEEKDTINYKAMIRMMTIITIHSKTSKLSDASN